VSWRSASFRATSATRKWASRSAPFGLSLGNGWTTAGLVNVGSRRQAGGDFIWRIGVFCHTSCCHARVRSPIWVVLAGKASAKRPFTSLPGVSSSSRAILRDDDGVSGN
jgi:hypothetical protein